MRMIVSAVLLCVLLGACGSKGALIMPPEPGSERQQSNTGKQN